MGYHFQYSGNLKSPDQLHELVIELEDICQTLDWPVALYEHEYPSHQFLEAADDRVFGLSFTPSGSDPVFFTFDASGKIFNPILKQLFDEGDTSEMKVITVKVNLDDENMEPVISDDEKEVDLSQVIYKISVNLESNDPAFCMQVIELIRYLHHKYLDDFHLVDDAGYWTSKDAGVLTKRMKSSRHILDKIQAKLEGRSFSDPEEFMRFIRLLGAYIQKSLREEEE